MTIVPLSIASLRRALAEGWRLANATRMTSIAYAAIFTLGGLVIIGGLLASGMTPFVIAAAGGFMLIGPPVLAGFFGIAQASESGQKPGLSSIVSGFKNASPSVWVVALVCALLFMIFITDAAILYSYMVGGAPVWLTDLVPATSGVLSFLKWGAASGFVVALLLFCVSAFSVPLLCERRASLVGAVSCSVKIVFGNFFPAMLWAALISSLIIGSILLLPLLPLTLPWLAYASRALYREVLPLSAT
ncbi:MAG: DUF2189 domain-containing protein [Rhodocyclaceae bacterium]|nr:DUF2189 domain-containing protein [Rhodocyclaceae bacterium]